MGTPVANRAANRVANVWLQAQGGEPGSRWEGAMGDLQAINELYAQIKGKPGNPATLRRCTKGINKLTRLFTWAKAALPASSLGVLLKVWRELGALAKAKDATPDEMRTGIERYLHVTQQILDSTAQKHFTYQGMKIDNPEHLPRTSCRIALDGLDYLQAIFRKRGVDAVLEQGIKSVILIPDAGASAFFNSRTRELTVSIHDLAKSGRFSDTFAGETLIHEFGHFIHRNYITGEAAAAWDAPWEGIPSLADPRNRRLRDDPERAKQLDPLDIVTDYGKVDQFEDFAETFLVFMIAPDKLTANAKYRMQRALSLSGLYGKPVMRNARNLSSSRVAARWLQATPSQRIKDAIAESMVNLPNNVQEDIETFAHGVLVGKAPSLERHTATMYKAFAPLRKVLGSVTMYRGEPINPPQIKRKWLSWTTSPSIAAQFAGRTDHIIEAKINVKDVVAGILSPHNDRYIEYLVLDRPQYHQSSPNQVPVYNSVSLAESGWGDDWPDDVDPWSDDPRVQDLRFPGWRRWLQDAQKAVERAGGMVIQVQEPDEDHNPYVGYILPPGVSLPEPWGAETPGTPMPRYLGRIAS